MKLVLIDRDGVINEEIEGFITSPDALNVLKPAIEALALLTKAGFTCVICTNQSVVGRGIIDEPMLNRIHDKLRGLVQAGGGAIADIFFCADHPDQPTYRRKPRPGMLIEAMEKYKAAPESTPFIGDALTDLRAAHEAGCKRYLVMTGKGRKTMEKLPDELRPVAIFKDLLEAAQAIVREAQ